MLPGIHSFSGGNLFHFHTCTEGEETGSPLNPGNKKGKMIILLENYCRHSVQNIEVARCLIQALLE